MRGQRWTDERDAAVAAGVAAGKRHAEIAAELDVTVEAVRKRVQRLGVAETRTTWTGAEIKRLREMMRLNWPRKMMADDLGRSENSVRGAIRFHGLRRERRKPPPKRGSFAKRIREAV